MRTIRKALVPTFGDENVLVVVDGEIQQPGPRKEVQVRVDYSAVSGADVNMRRGTYPFQKKAPFTPGYSLIGTVESNGVGCSKFSPNSRVACLSIYGAHAEIVNVPEEYLVPVPGGLDVETGAALVLDWISAYQMVNRSAQVKAGDRVFVHGLSGAVGCAILALATLQGADVYGTASPKKHKALRDLGATPYTYEDKAWFDSIHASGGVDAVFDALGHASFNESYSILRRGGVLVGFGMNLPAVQGVPSPSIFPPMLKLMSRNLAVWSGKRTAFYSVNRKDKSFATDLGTLFEMLRTEKISVAVKGVFRLEDIRNAHRAWRESANIGSIIVAVQA